jgi:S1-C subfamily serine protease
LYLPHSDFAYANYNEVMHAFNWIDGIIFLLLIAAIWGSLRTGLARLLCLIAGFFGALFIAGWLFPHLLPFEDRTIRTIVNANLVLLAAALGGYKGYALGRHIHVSLPEKFKNVESALGILPGILATLFGIWLLAATIGRLPFVGLSNSANDALVVQALSRLLPPPPAVLAAFNQQVDPNDPPALLTSKTRPDPSFNFSYADFENASAKASDSIVKITSFGCGGIGNGTGFSIGENLVMTNAHVVAGVERPIIKYDNHSYEAIPVLFKPDLDIAILRVTAKTHPFKAPPLGIAKDSAALDTTVAVLGYPDGDYKATPGIIRSDRVVFGRNIYDMGQIPRNIYEVQGRTTFGHSGSPLVLADGSVAGMVFSRYEEHTQYALALTSLHIVEEIERAETLNKRVGTGVCYAS